METANFIDLLENHSALEIEFHMNSNKRIDGNFHITEVLNARYETIDCGANLHEFRETIIQIIDAKESSDGLGFTATKAAIIFDKALKNTRLDVAAPIFVEYGDLDFPTQKLPVDRVAVKADRLQVFLGTNTTQCKPSQKKDDRPMAVGCC